MNDSLFRLIFGIIMVIGPSVWLFYFLRGEKKSNDDSEMLSLSRLKIVLSLLTAIIIGLCVLFYDFFLMYLHPKHPMSRIGKCLLFFGSIDYTSFAQYIFLPFDFCFEFFLRGEVGEILTGE